MTKEIDATLKKVVVEYVSPAPHCLETQMTDDLCACVATSLRSSPKRSFCCRFGVDRKMNLELDEVIKA